MFSTNGLSNEAIGILRNCVLSWNPSDEAGSFIRCGRKLGLDKAHKIAAEIRACLGDDETQVMATFNAETGHDDYIRVNRGSAAFRLVCHMKS